MKFVNKDCYKAEIGDTLLGFTTFIELESIYMSHPTKFPLETYIKFCESIVLHERILYFTTNLWSHFIDFEFFVPISKELLPTEPELSSEENFGVAEILTGISNFEKNYSNEYGITYSCTDTPSKYTIFQQQALTLTSDKAKKEIKKNNLWIYENYFSLDTPLIFNYVVQKATSFEDILNICLELRNSKEAIMFRKMSKAFEASLKAEDNDNLVFIIEEMESGVSKLSNKISTEPTIPIDISYPLGFSIDTTKVLENLGMGKKRHLEFISRLFKSATQSNSTTNKFYKLLEQN